jgi:hypothetical protein
MQEPKRSDTDMLESDKQEQFLGQAISHYRKLFCEGKVLRIQPRDT